VKAGFERVVAKLGGGVPVTSSTPPPSAPSSEGHQLRLSVLPQPNNTTCGPTCLHAVYRYWEYELPLQEVIDTVEPLPEGGTLAVRLAIHALRRNFRAEIYTYNLQILPLRLRARVQRRLRRRAGLAERPLRGAARL
jgi:hypothetical protein